MKNKDGEIRKITVNLPASLIDPLMDNSDMSLTETIKQALREYKQRRAYDALLKLHGTGGLTMSYEELKELRD